MDAGAGAYDSLKGVVNCQNSRDKGPPEGNSARGCPWVGQGPIP